MLSLHAPSSSIVNNVQLTLSTCHPVYARKNTLHVHSVKGGAHTPLILAVPFYCAPGVTPSSLTVHVVAASLLLQQPKQKDTVSQPQHDIQILYPVSMVGIYNQEVVVLRVLNYIIY